MPLERTITGSSDPNQDPFGDVEHISDVSNVNTSRTDSHITSKLVNEVDLVDGSVVGVNDVLLGNSQGQFYPAPLQTVIDGATDATQGYYGLLSPFYFGGVATETIIDTADVDTMLKMKMFSPFLIFLVQSQ